MTSTMIGATMSVSVRRLGRLRGSSASVSSSSAGPRPAFFHYRSRRRRTRHDRRGTRDAGLDAGLSAHAAALLRSGGAAVPGEGDRHRHGRRAASARPTASGPSAPAGSAACSTTSASPTTAGSATFAWNTARHLELYFAAPCTGRVLHTLNIRLFPEQLTYIVNHAEDEVIFVDRSLLGAAVAAGPHVRDRAALRRDGRRQGRRARRPTAAARSTTTRTCSPAPTPVEFHVDDENRAASMCYTSGTTGNPKGVVYSHRSTFLHTMGAMTADGLGVRESDVDPAGRADVPRQRVGPRARRASPAGANARHARARPVAAGDRQPHREGAASRSPPACRRSGWACCPS